MELYLLETTPRQCPAKIEEAIEQNYWRFTSELNRLHAVVVAKPEEKDWLGKAVGMFDLGLLYVDAWSPETLNVHLLVITRR